MSSKDASSKLFSSPAAVMKVYLYASYSWRSFLAGRLPLAPLPLAPLPLAPPSAPRFLEASSAYARGGRRRGGFKYATAVDNRWRRRPAVLMVKPDADKHTK